MLLPKAVFLPIKEYLYAHISFIRDSALDSDFLCLNSLGRQESLGVSPLICQAKRSIYVGSRRFGRTWEADLQNFSLVAH